MTNLIIRCAHTGVGCGNASNKLALQFPRRRLRNRRVFNGIRRKFGWGHFPQAVLGGILRLHILDDNLMHVGPEARFINNRCPPGLVSEWGITLHVIQSWNSRIPIRIVLSKWKPATEMPLKNLDPVG